MVTIQAPSSKSVSHRVVIAAALAPGVSVVERVLESKDLERTMAILAAAGAEIRREHAGTYHIRGVAGVPRGGSDTPLSCDVHESGTTCRLLTAVLAAGSGRFRIHGAPRMHERPLGELCAALETLGVRLAFAGRPGYPPLVLSTRGLAPAADGSPCRIGLGESSQYLSGLLLAAPLAQGPLTLAISGDKVVSWPYVGLTLQTLELFGVPFSVETRPVGQSGAAGEAAWQEADWRGLTEARPGGIRFRMRPAAYRPGRYAAEGDWSGASYFLAAGAVGPAPVRVEGLNMASLQGDRAMLDILRRMGARVETQDPAVTVFPSSLHGIDVDMGACPDLVPTVAVLAAHAQGVTRVRNVAHLRIKESDRIAAPAEELARIGVRSREYPDGLEVHGVGRPPLAPGSSAAAPRFSSHGDHRMAMSLALLELHGRRIELDDPACVSKSFPTFWDQWSLVRGQ